MDIAPADLTADVLYQLGALDAFARAAGTRVRYVKPHGALYNTAADDPVQAGAVAAAVARYDPRCRCSGCPLGSWPRLRPRPASRSSPRRSPTARTRRPAGSCRAPRPARCITTRRPSSRRRCRSCATAWCTRSTARRCQVRAASLCLHGDTPGAVALARAVRAALEDAGAMLAPFAPMKVLPYGERALLAELDDPHRRAGLRAGRRPSRASSTRSPARRPCWSCSIRRAPRSVRRATRSIGEICAAVAQQNSPRSVDVPVVYDGADLDAVAANVDLSPSRGRRPARRRRVHRAVLRVLPRLRLPGRARPAAARRRATRSPRTAVPAGSVAIAGEFTGVYPRSSPGGWRLLGRTDATLWDVAPRPARAAHARHAGAVRAGMIEIVAAGPLATVQDLGRPGWASLGVPRSGAFDRAAARLANRLVGNAGRRAVARDHSRRPGGAGAGGGDLCPDRRGVSRRRLRGRVQRRRRAHDRGSAFRRGRAAQLPRGARRARASTRCSARAAPTCSAGSDRRRLRAGDRLPVGREPVDDPSGADRRRDPLLATAAHLARPRELTGSPPDALGLSDEYGVDGAGRVRPDRPAPGRPAAATRPRRRAAQRADAARRAAGARRRPADPARAGRSGDRRLPGDRGARRCRPRPRRRSFVPATSCGSDERDVQDQPTSAPRPRPRPGSSAPTRP